MGAALLTAALIGGASPLLLGDADAAVGRAFTGIAARSGGDGYLLSSTRGEMYAFGGASAVRNPAGFTGDIVDVALTADGRGALAVSSAGQFYAYGTARSQPNPVGFSGRIVGVALTADGQGAMAVSSAGQFYAYGTARAQNNPVGFGGEIVDVALTADGRGAMAVSSIGQFYAYGTARAQKNPSGFSGRIVGLDLTADGQGVMAMSSAGQFYAYGSATAQPNPTRFSGEMTALDLTGDGRGVVAMSSTGQVYAYGTARHYGNGDSGCTPYAGTPVCFDIRARYQALGGPDGPLGAPTSGEFAVVNNGRGQHFRTGSIYWSAGTGAWDVRGVIRDKYFSMAAERGVLGLPTSGESFSNGRYGSRFTNGSIYFSGPTGTHEVHGEINEVYARNGYAEGRLGMPLTDEVDAAGPWAGGRLNFFTTGYVVWDGRSTKVGSSSRADMLGEARSLQDMSLDNFVAVQRGLEKSRDPLNWDTDGCSAPWFIDLDAMFLDACHRHDLGNKTFGPKHQGLDTSSASLDRVNNRFKQDMLTICAKHGNPRGCGTIADAAYKAVYYNATNGKHWWR
ncbi:hypothetical protein JIG36_22150 [Actinoplanes sp. LDG1-06]|uniref:Uncharacterized protein n=1 Tax=Paractinoplanes ovalisporus TaxID=2810368 RepID=A0ABS2AEJ9_9ACTN|nr:phospholipase A2 [Actinoplanes ovalisporus]MBM2618266.1 hypothetical protein [Actinoplanes ovalisporus]